MKYAHIVDAVFRQPWLITPEAHASIRQIVREHMAGVASKREGTDICGGAVEVDQMEIRKDGVAVIPVGGVLGRKLSGFQKGAGAVDYMDIEKELDEAESDERVRAIVFEFDSPGGMAMGAPELATTIAQSQKPTIAWIPGMACSAALYLASSADVIIAAPSSLIGSIGAYLPWVDESRAFENQGLEADPITSGPYKAAGFPGTSLTEAQRSHLQSYVDSIHHDFVNHIRTMRGPVPDEAMKGQSFRANEAIEYGLVDEIANSMKEALALVL